MHELAMSDAEFDELTMVLEAAIRDLSLEIAGTDSPEWRHLLRSRRELCAGLLERMSTSTATARTADPVIESVG